MEITYRLEDIEKVCSELCGKLKHRIVLFYAPMGSGKTTLINRILKQLGSEEVGQSPTFSLVNEHELSTKEVAYHFDLYRLHSIEEAWDIGIEEYIDSGNWCFIEWPEVVETLIPEEHHTITLETIDANTRKLTMH